MTLQNFLSRCLRPHAPFTLLDDGEALKFKFGVTIVTQCSEGLGFLYSREIDRIELKSNQVVFIHLKKPHPLQAPLTDAVSNAQKRREAHIKKVVDKFFTDNPDIIPTKMRESRAFPEDSYDFTFSNQIRIVTGVPDIQERIIRDTEYDLVSTKALYDLRNNVVGLELYVSCADDYIAIVDLDKDNLIALRDSINAVLKQLS